MDGIFDPFEKRISRDIRNALSIHFLDLLEKGNWKAFEQKTAPLKAAAPDAGHIRYIEDRVETYRKVFCHTRETPFETALALWKSKLFFECHEWLEPLWLRADGDFKKAVQGIIRAAGAHALDEAGRDGPARSSAQKALILIQTHREKIPPPFDAEKLSGSLKRIINSQAAG